MNAKSFQVHIYQRSPLSPGRGTKQVIWLCFLPFDFLKLFHTVVLPLLRRAEETSGWPPRPPPVRPELNRREEGLSSLHLKCQAWDLREGHLNIKLLREKKKVTREGRKVLWPLDSEEKKEKNKGRFRVLQNKRKSWNKRDSPIPMKTKFTEGTRICQDNGKGSH